MTEENSTTAGVRLERIVSAHTPGPWKCYMGGGASRPTVGSAQGNIAVLSTRRASATAHERNLTQARADGRLIEAAPNLLAAALECMDCELGDMACIGSMAPAEHALGLLQAAVALAVGANA